MPFSLINLFSSQHSKAQERRHGEDAQAAERRRSCVLKRGPF